MDRKSSSWLGLAAVLAGSLMIVVVALAWPGLVETLGHRIPQENLQADYLVALLWAIVLGISLMFWPVRRHDKFALALIWFVRVAIALGFMLVYESSYGLDAYNYFRRSLPSEFVWTGFELGQGTSNIWHFAAIHHQIFPDSYHMLKISFSLLGLFAIYIYYRAAVLFLGREDQRILYIIAFFPSILFWSSILGKDPVMFLAIALYVYGVVGWFKRKHLRYLLWLVAGVVLSMFIRSWMGPILLAPLAILMLWGVRGLFPRLVMLLVLGAAMSQSLDFVLARFSVDSAEELLETTDKVSKAWAEGGSAQQVAIDFSSPRQIATFVPLGAFTALFRPLLGEVRNPFGLLAGLENVLLLLLLYRALRRSRWKDLQNPVVLWALLLLGIWSSIYGFISFQNLGTAVRYKLQVLPVLLGLLLYLARPRQLQARAAHDLGPGSGS